MDMGFLLCQEKLWLIFGLALGLSSTSSFFLFIVKCGGFVTGCQGTQQTETSRRVLQAIFDHGSDISNLSDDDKRDDDDVNLGDINLQSNTDESSDSVASETDSDGGSDDEPLNSLTKQAVSRWKQARSFNPDVSDIPQIDDDRDRSTWAPIDYMNE